ncbi:TonB-dependent receptor [Sphingomonas sp. SUN019]|uniref:TonB-dependent receptor n=1 Tax=Sphingomonas sp. SUN019 TaxID=2937788 RepID=UPI0021642D25|nr:TonB-dependent receptor [Sphingomonas sp. SUN019]UVO51982.1 TonB-dependent receptor [Sphingomonas sp. SUN019]
MRKGWLTASAAAVIVAAGSAQAQDAPPAPDATAAQATQIAPDDIIVTANRREQNLQSVGISISALTGEQMRALNVNTALDIANTSPNIEIIRSYAAPGFNTQITIRGVGQPDFQDTTEATATAYVDDFYMIGAGQADFLSFDIARTEVARGPQGTVQGRNSTAGSINYYTNRPEFDDTSARLLGTVAMFGTFRSEGMANFAISDSFAIRGAFSFDHGDGYLRNINPESTWRDGGKSKFWAGRLQAYYKPNEDFSLLLKAEYGRMGPVAAGNEKAYPVGAIPGLPGTYALATDAFGQNQANIGASETDVTNANGANEISSKMQHYLATMTFRASDTLSFTALGGYLKSNKYSVEDCDHTPLAICNFSNQSRSTHWMTEARGLFDSGPFRLTFGGNYLDHKIRTTSGTPLFFSPDITPFVTSYYGQGFLDRQRLKSYAFFGQGEFDIGDRVTLIAGVRYTHDDKVLDSIDAFTLDIPLTTPLPRTIEAFEAFRQQVFASPGAVFTILNRQANGDLAVFNKGLFNANAQVNFKPSDDVLLYAGYRRGVKSGGFITGNVAGTDPALRPFKEETNNAYEVGVKSTFANGVVRFNAALFYYDYQDMQNTSLIGITNVITNNDAKIYGGEAELTLRPMPGLNIFAAGGYVHTKVQDIFNPTGAVPILSDNRLPLAPRFTANARVRYEWDSLGGGLFVQGAARYRTSMFRDSLNNPSTRIPSIFVADALAGYNAPDDRWGLSVYVNNIFDTRRPINLFDVSAVGNSGEVVYNFPRWAGATLSVRF